jgi:hypothetical protein
MVREPPGRRKAIVRTLAQLACDGMIAEIASDTSRRRHRPRRPPLEIMPERKSPTRRRGLELRGIPLWKVIVI